MSAPDFKVGDLVCIFKQPSTQIAGVEGQIGYIDEVQRDPFFYVCTIREDGRSLGAGSIPRDCLRIETSPKWVRAKALREEEQARTASEINWHSSHSQAQNQAIAEKNQLSKAQFEAIKLDITSSRS